MLRRRVRSAGPRRRTRRALARGGVGVAGNLNDAVGGWPRVRIVPMFGRWGYFVGETFFGCFPLRAKDHDLWIRLSPGDQARALKTPGITPHRRFAKQGWIECQVDSPAAVPLALRWLRRSYEWVTSQPARD